MSRPASQSIHTSPGEGVDVSVVVPAYNAEGTIAACVESLLAQDTVELYEIIVVDDGSTDRTAEAAQASGARVLRGRNGGAASARNLGIREARGSIVLFTDADCRATPRWLDLLVAAIRSGADGAKGTFLSDQREVVARFMQLEYEEKYRGMVGRERIDFIDMGSAAYRRDVLIEAAQGGFDTRFPGASVEDQELSFRLAREGAVLRFVPEAAVYHLHRTSVRDYALRKLKIGWWKAQVHVRHPARLFSDSHTPISLKAQMLLFYLFVLGVAARVRGLAPLSALVFAVSVLPFTLRAARRDPSVATVAPLLLAVRAAALGTGFALGWARLLALLVTKPALIAEMRRGRSRADGA